MEEFKISAPGKIILCGEHAVVYGKKALASSIGLRVHLHSKKPTPGNQFFEIYLKNTLNVISFSRAKFESIQEIYKNKSTDEIIKELSDLQVDNKATKAVMLMVSALGESLQWDSLSGVNVEVFSEIPLGSGLGSSAAYAVCLSTFFLIKSNKITLKENSDFSDQERKLINENAFLIEKIFHGRPSGVDNTVSTYGGYVLYEKGQFEKVPCEFDLKVLLIDSLVPKKTIDQVNKVRQMYEKHKSLYEPLMNIVNDLVTKFADIIKEKDSDKLELNDLITLNHGLLHSMHVSNLELGRIVGIAQSNGFSCKITGSGGGGCCYALLIENQKTGTDGSDQNSLETRLETFVKDLEKQQFNSFRAFLGVDGVRLEKI